MDARRPHWWSSNKLCGTLTAKPRVASLRAEAQVGDVVEREAEATPPSLPGLSSIGLASRIMAL